MARWLRRFLIISFVAILNIVGFMYMTGYSFILWGTPVEQKYGSISKNNVPSSFLDRDVGDILRRPAAKDALKDTKSEHNIDLGGISQNVMLAASQNQSGQSPQKQQSFEGIINLQLKQNMTEMIVLSKPGNDLKEKQPLSNELEVNVQHADQQSGNQQQQGQQQQGSAIKTQQDTHGNKQLNVQIHSELAEQMDKMKQEMEVQQAVVAHQQQNIQQNEPPQTDLQQQPAPNIQVVGPNQQDTPVANSKLLTAQLHTQQKFIDPAILKDIVSKAKPPNTNKVFPHDYKVVMNEPNSCLKADGSVNGVFLLVLVNTIHKNFEQRRAIRSTWASVKEVDGKHVVTMFLLAKNNDAKLNEVVQEESMQYHDLLMEDFVDTYKNLTLKTIMGTKWAAMNCPEANFVLKTDDDMFINYESLVRYLADPSTPTKNHVAGFLINGGPIRDPKSKWYMPRETYPGNKYPPFCSGTGYVMSGDVALKVYAISEYTPFLYLEDVYVAICLEKLGIVPVRHKEFHNWRTAYSYCHFRRIITTHMVTPIEMNRIWKDQHSKKGFRC